MSNFAPGVGRCLPNGTCSIVGVEEGGYKGGGDSVGNRVCARLEPLRQVHVKGHSGANVVDDAAGCYLQSSSVKHSWFAFTRDSKMRLLETFRGVFEGKQYLHRKSNLGDLVAVEFYEDLANLAKSTKLAQRTAAHDRVVNLKNVAVGKKARRGDGTLGERVPSAVARLEEGYIVARGPTANIEIGAETKILAKAMIKQIDRVISDLRRQVEMFKQQGGNPICIGIVGINFSDRYTSFEGTREFRTDGKEYKHPIQEAAEAENRLRTHAAPAFDEFLILRFRATNEEPYPFAWQDFEALRLEYSALLTRVSREYDKRF